ncbi:hypothetical protein NOLU111490_17345 [Novosphingobium lubricantis]
MAVSCYVLRKWHANCEDCWKTKVPGCEQTT